MKKIFIVLMLIAFAAGAYADGGVTVTGVTAQQRYPWNGKVDIVVTLEGPSNDLAWVECTFVATNVDTKETLPVTHIATVGSDTGSDNIWKRRFLWDASIDIGAVKVDDVAVTVDIKWSGGVQLWENGPCWAECNVGATKPEEYGYYFWWGDTVGYKRNASDNGWVSVIDGSSFQFYVSNCPTYGKNNSTLQSLGYIDSTGNLVAAHDAATVHLGAPWRMPTDAEMSALISNCTTTWTTRNGVYGRLVTGKGDYASKSIFLPAAGDGYGSGLYDPGSVGYYWSSTPNSGDSYDTWYLRFVSGDFYRSNIGRVSGRSVRPLRGFSGDMSGVAICDGFAAHLKLDCRTDSRVAAAEGEMLYYDINWYDGASTIVMTDNGVEIGAGENGELLWHPTTCGGGHTLQLKAVSSTGSQVGLETIEFMLNHVEVVTTAAEEPTCTESGCTKGSYCSRCNAVLATSTARAALGHLEVVTTAAKEPTCTMQGCTQGTKCSRCNAILTASEELHALGHDEFESVTAKAATCTETGYTKETKCNRCDVVLSRSKVVPALGHEEEIMEPAVSPEGTNCGYTAEIVCSRCGVTLQERTVVWTNVPVVVTKVTAQQRYPWNGKVDIAVTFQGLEEDVAATICTFAATNGATQAAIPLTHVTRHGNDVGSGITWTRKFVWDADDDVGSVKVDDIMIIVQGIDLGGVQLWENGPYWNECNIGATAPEDAGYYFWWGGTSGFTRQGGNWWSCAGSCAYENVTWVASDGYKMYSSPFDSSRETFYGKSESDLRASGSIDAEGNLVAALDAATHHLGAPWRMPTAADFSSLISNCNTSWTNCNGVCGRLVTGKGSYASKSVFFPAVGSASGSTLYYPGLGGEYWTSTPDSSNYAYSFYAYSSYCSLSRSDRYAGNPIRPLRGFGEGVAPLAFGNGPTAVTHLKLNCLTGVREPSVNGEILRYDADWYESCDAVRIMDNGVAIQSGSAGTYLWKPISDRTLHTLEMQALSNGNVVATETVQYTLGYIRNVTARQLWPQGKVEICYEIADDIVDVCPLDSMAMLAIDSSNGVDDFLSLEIENWSEGQWQIKSDGDATSYAASIGYSGGGAVMRAKVYGATKIAFDWMSSGEYASAVTDEYDKHLISSYPKAVLRLNVDGKNVARIGRWSLLNGGDWRSESISLEPNVEHTLEWIYDFDHKSCNTYGDNHGIVCNVDLSYVRVEAESIQGNFGVTPGVHKIFWDLPQDKVYLTQDKVTFNVSLTSGEKVSTSAAIDVKKNMIADGCSVFGYSEIDGLVTIIMEDEVFLSATNCGEFVWQPKRLGENTITHIAGTNVWTRTVNVTELGFVTQKDPAPPGTVDETISLGLDKKTFTSAARKPCMFAVTSTTEDKEWSASVSDDWITLTKTSGVCGTDKVTYYAEANTNAAERTGYVYVSGHVHTVVQPGVGAELQVADPLAFDCNGTAQTVTVKAAEGVHWDILPKAEWITIQPTSGDATGTVTLCAAPFVCVGSRTGTAIVAGQEVTFTQNGCDMQLSYYVTNCTKTATTVTVGVKAIAGKSWTATSQAEWITISGAGAGVGNGEVVLSVAANAGHLTRTGFVTIGTETFKIVQEPSAPHLSTTVLDCESAESVVQVDVFIDSYVRWNVSNELDWVEFSGDVSRVGPDAVQLHVAANTDITARSGVLSIAGFEVTINQAASDVALSQTDVVVPPAGRDVEIAVTAPDYLQWQVGALPTWVTLSGESVRVGSAALTFTVATNEGIEDRECEIAIGGKKLKVRQLAAGTTVLSDRIVHGSDSDFGQFSVTAEDYLSWNAMTTNDWIDFSSGTAFTGSGEIEYIYGDLGVNKSRIGIIWVGKTPVYVCQSGFETALGETEKTVSRVSDDGQIAVDVEADEDEWCALSTVPWITVKTPSGTGDGFVQYSYEDNTTGVVRVGRILVCDQVFTLTQTYADPSIPRWQISYENLQGAAHANPNHYDEGDVLTFTAPTGGRTGYTFAGWNPSGIAAADTGDKSVRASWTANAYSVVFDANGGTGEMANQAFTYGEEKALTACGFTRDGYAFLGWGCGKNAAPTWGDGVVVSNLTATAGEDVRLYAQWTAVPYAITYVDTKEQPNANPSSYTIADAVVFAALGDVANFTFAGWTPTALAVGTTGDQTVTANWNWVPSDGVVEAAITGGKPMDIKADWAKKELTQRFGAGKDRTFREKFGADFAAALIKPTGKRDGAGNELAVWHDYVAGTDPTDTNSVFKAKVEIKNGLPVVEWEPNLNSNSEERVYTIWGKTNLTDAAWHTPTNECSKFFKVDVAMPNEGTVSFNLGGASGSIDSKSIRVGQPIGDVPTPVRAGYDFLGWFTAAEGGDKVTADTIVTADLSIYAHWKGSLLHRWSFNGNLNDSVGGVTAQYIGSASLAWTSDNKAISLAGGSHGQSGVNLGGNLLPTTGTAMTIEMWAKGRSLVDKCNRVFEIGYGTTTYGTTTVGKDTLQMMWWTNPTSQSEIMLMDEGSLVTGARTLWNAFTVGTEYHIAVRIEPGESSTTISFTRRVAATGANVETATWVIDSVWSLSDFRQDVFYLGRSLWSCDTDSAADYNEVRIWNRALTDDELTASVLSGPDAEL